MVSVKVVYQSSGSPASGVRVAISEDSWTAMGVYSEHTDSSGEAHFPSVSPGERYLYIDGKEYKKHLAGMNVFYV